MVIYTIGYEGLSLAQFLELIAARGIRRLIDIREAPISRKAGFARAELEAAVVQAGVGYAHVRALGCPKPIRDRYRKSGDFERYSRDFGIYLAGQAAALTEVRATAVAEPTCLLCYEADFNRCHRGLVAAAMLGPGDRVEHIPAKPLSPQAELRFE